MNNRIGHRVFGLGGIAFGIVTVVWHQISEVGGLSHPAAVVIAVGLAELLAGLAVQWEKTEKFGALTLTALFAIFSLYWIPQMATLPLDFAPWGNFFEQFSMGLGGVFVLGSTVRENPKRAKTIEGVAYGGFGISVITYALYQLFYIRYTAGLVPLWIPPGQMFWAVATTVAFALAAVTLLSGRFALLASRLLTAMLVLFGFLVWLPPAFADVHKMSNWQEFASNLAITGTSWIVAELLARPGAAPPRWAFARFRAERGSE